jgi:hypothetical protein
MRSTATNGLGKFHAKTFCIGIFLRILAGIHTL